MAEIHKKSVQLLVALKKAGFEGLTHQIERNLLDLPEMPEEGVDDDPQARLQKEDEQVEHVLLAIEHELFLPAQLLRASNDLLSELPFSDNSDGIRTRYIAISKHILSNQYDTARSIENLALEAKSAKHEIRNALELNGKRSSNE